MTSFRKPYALFLLSLLDYSLARIMEHVFFLKILGGVLISARQTSVFNGVYLIHILYSENNNLYVLMYNIDVTLFFLSFSGGKGVEGSVITM